MLGRGCGITGHRSGLLGPWTLPGAGCSWLPGGGDCRLSTLQKIIFNVLIYFLSSRDRVSLWGKLRVYLSVFLSGLPFLPYLTNWFSAPLGANLWRARNGRGSARFDPSQLSSTLLGCRREAPKALCLLRQGRSSPPSALKGGGRCHRVEARRGERVLYKPGASLRFLGDPEGGSYDPLTTPLSFILTLPIRSFCSLHAPNSQCPGGGPLPLGDSDSAPTLFPI